MSLRLTVIILLLAVSSLSAATHYVSLQSTNQTPPYTNWATAAKIIQDAVDASEAGDVVLVTNGVYDVGQKDVGTGPSRVVITNRIALLSVNGPRFTVIDGSGAVRCGSLADAASTGGFTLTNGVTEFGNTGAGVWCASTNVFLTNCTLTHNSNSGGQGGGVYHGTLYNCTLSSNSAYDGAGAYGSTLYNCILTSNSAVPAVSSGSGNGGGANSSTLYNCTLTDNLAVPNVYRSSGIGGGAYDSALFNCALTGNSAYFGGGAGKCTLYDCTLTGNATSDYNGGADNCTLNNCIVYFNTAGTQFLEPNCDYTSTLNYCCTARMPTNGIGNITNAPLFVDYANGNLRLQSNSPCVNAGNNAYVTTATDIDGRPRIVGGTVDIGAYEFQPGVSGAFIGWLQQYALPTDGSADYTDADHDGMNNWQEWICGTCPTNPLSALRLLSATPRGTNATVTWQSVAGVNYFLERSANLSAPFTFVATNIIGQAGTTSHADTNATGAGPFFYRVGVKSL